MPQPDTIIAMDPPEHTRLRRVVAQAFTMRRIERMRPRLQELVDGILDTFEKQGPPVDLVQMFALPVSAAAVCELLGVPFGDRDRFAAWIDLIMSSESTPDQVRHADAEQRSYLADLIALRREQPAEDLLTVLVETRDAGDQLTEEEMIALAGSVLVAGYMVTAVHMRNFVYALLADPDLNQQLREQPDLIPHAIEEMVRYIPPSIGEGLPRVATEDVELGGVTVRAGEAVLPSTMSANRDNAVFDAPDQMDVTRQDNPHLGFGFGVHRCVGAQLARVEMQVAIASLLARFPDLRLTTPASEVPYRTDTIWTGPEELQATW
jgi:cytochrome P450